MAAHVHLKNVFTEDEKRQISWDCSINFFCSFEIKTELTGHRLPLYTDIYARIGIVCLSNLSCHINLFGWFPFLFISVSRQYEIYLHSYWRIFPYRLRCCWFHCWYSSASGGIVSFAISLFKCACFECHSRGIRNVVLEILRISLIETETQSNSNRVKNPRETSIFRW